MIYHAHDIKRYFEILLYIFHEKVVEVLGNMLKNSVLHPVFILSSLDKSDYLIFFYFIKMQNFKYCAK